MQKLRQMTLVLLLGFGVTSSMLPIDAYAVRKCRTNDGTSGIVYGTQDYYGFNRDGTPRTNEQLFGGSPPPGGLTSRDPDSREPVRVENPDEPEDCPGPPVRDPDQHHSPRMHTTSRGNRK